MVQWSWHHTSTAGGMGSIPGRGTKIPHVVGCSQKKERILWYVNLNSIFKKKTKQSPNQHWTGGKACGSVVIQRRSPGARLGFLVELYSHFSWPPVSHELPASALSAQAALAPAPQRCSDIGLCILGGRGGTTGNFLARLFLAPWWWNATVHDGVYKFACRFGIYVCHLCRNIISHCYLVFIMSIYRDLPLRVTFYTQCRFLYTLEHMCFSNLAFGNSWFSKRCRRRLSVGSEISFLFFYCG